MSLGGRLLLPAGADRFQTPAYHAPAREARRGGLLVLHALWGVTPHIRDLCDAFAGEGWECLAPSLLERWDPGFALEDIEPERFEARQAAVQASGFGPLLIGDLRLAVGVLQPPVCVIGFCFGGTAAFLAACRCDGLVAAASFYGGEIVRFRAERPRCGLSLHFGREDELISAADVEKIAAAQPEAQIWLYDAGHAFVAPASERPDAARLGLLRARQQFHRAVSGARLDGP
jgi:carboxymethylenebutenolidase